MLAYEINFPEQLSDPLEWETWRSEVKINKQNRVKSLDTIRQRAPIGVDRLHARLAEKIESGQLCLTDRILFNCRLKVNQQNPEVLYVRTF